ncbi:alanine racemase [Hyphomicrobium sp.]|jgi:alanine racemase|uniref:alanine racemase n=1 Tax=Hyphomicrobium sp. TaxID=82 RepID=UPI002B96BB08|nr:alanine racemase [Hyphomicrobium sp.]HVZ03118.1 alanine racemase [Hyphomicrobium sp.]
MTALAQRSRASSIPKKAHAPARDSGRTKNPHLDLEIDLGSIRHNVEAIAKTTGVPVLPVVKADAYGLGIETISRTIADIAAGFCVFQAREAVAVDLAGLTRKRVLVLGPPESSDPADYDAHDITPSVYNAAQARQLRRARPALCVDTGMQRFSCPPDDCREAVVAGDCREIFTHATRLGHVEKFENATCGFNLPRHAAASALLHEERAMLDAVRPGLAMYRNAINISARIVEIHDSGKPAGYSGFVVEQHGIILAGYSHGLRKGPCLINGRKSRLLEVGMESAFVELDPWDRVGDRVVLLGGELTELELAQWWDCSPHEVLTSMSFAATRRYVC